VARLRRRIHEHAAELASTPMPSLGSGRFAKPGMPLGQPPLDAERLQLIRSWIAQGAPGPDGIATTLPRTRSASGQRRRM
jgi:hypothetical protein